MEIFSHLRTTPNMSHVIIYANTRQLQTLAREVAYEIHPDCIAEWQAALKAYCVSPACIRAASDAYDLCTQLKDNQTAHRKVTVIIPEGYAVGVMLSFLEAGVHKLLTQMIHRGEANCLGSCAGMTWMTDSLIDIPSEHHCFPGCVSSNSFQQALSGEHFRTERTPIVKSNLLPG